MTRSHGQAALETLLALPLVLLVVAALAQILWLFLAQQMLQSASLHVVRQGSLDGMNQAAMLQVLEKRMRPLPGRALHIPRIRRLHPDDEMVRGQGTKVRKGSRQYYELASDFSSARLHELDDDEAREAWLRARILQIEIIWCQPLLVPLAAQLIAAFNAVTAEASQQYCNAQSLMRRPMMAIRVQAAAQLVAPLRVAANRRY